MFNLKKTPTLAVAASTLVLAAPPAIAQAVKIVFLADVTGPIVGFAPGMVDSGNVVVISPASTASAVAELADNDLVFRDVVPDSIQSVKAAELLLAQGIIEVGVAYVNNDYGSGLAGAFSDAFTAGGGTVAVSVSHEDGKADYRP
ncbi:MAG: hypothetical protein MO852_09335 [Candidatus Devosia euplotis]|nr:hypothetical protein [Candidatus Devosia euplotis]